MKKTKIEWCDCTINPVVGCKNGCPYCYARRINDRFHIIPKWDEPQFFPGRLKAFESKKPKSVFVNSMSDVSNWEPEWIKETMQKIKENPQHNYIFLSKDWHDAYANGFEFENCWNGLTVTRQKDLGNHIFERFLSIEPILEPINLYHLIGITATDYVYFPFCQVIIGAETGNRKGKVIPKKEWIDNIVRLCDKYDVKVFMKDSLIPIVGEENMRRDLVWAIRPKEEL